MLYRRTRNNYMALIKTALASNKFLWGKMNSIYENCRLAIMKDSLAGYNVRIGFLLIYI